MIAYHNTEMNKIKFKSRRFNVENNISKKVPITKFLDQNLEI